MRRGRGGRVGAGSVSLMEGAGAFAGHRGTGQLLSLKSVGLAGAARGWSLLLQIGFNQLLFQCNIWCVLTVEYSYEPICMK